jgi:acyl dehydratase
MHFEQLQVGDTVRSAPRVLSRADVDAMAAFNAATGLMGTAENTETDQIPHSLLVILAADLAVEADLFGAELVSVDAGGWTVHSPVRVKDELTLTSTIVRLRPTPENGCGLATVERTLLRNGDEGPQLVLSGSTVASVAATGADRCICRDVGTEAWGNALADRLSAQAAFSSSVSSWDGTIGLRGGADEIHLRVYRGAIIEVTRRTPLGPTFTMGTTDALWADIFNTPRLRFGTRVMLGQFEIQGNAYEYLRLIKAMELIVQTAWAMARHDGSDEPAC